MRKIHNAERIQRGCAFCADCGWIKKKLDRVRGCPYDVCPYHQLDKVKRYDDYLKSIGADTMYMLLKSLGMNL